MSKLNFSQRMGISPIKSIQINSMDDDLRNSLWNVFYGIFELILRGEGTQRLDISYNKFFLLIWREFFNLPIDEIHGAPRNNIEFIKQKYYSGSWDYPYRFIEFLVEKFDDGSLQNHFNKIFEKECSGYRFIDGILSPVIEIQDIEEINLAIMDDKYSGASIHIRAALAMLSDRENHDYRNSIKESISAVESTMKVISNDPNATFGKGISTLDKAGVLHPRLKSGFESLYNYTNDSKTAARHAIFNDSIEITQADARYFLVSCSAFVNYLKELSIKK